MCLLLLVSTFLLHQSCKTVYMGDFALSPQLIKQCPRSYLLFALYVYLTYCILNLHFKGLQGDSKGKMAYLVYCATYCKVRLKSEKLCRVKFGKYFKDYPIMSSVCHSLLLHISQSRASTTTCFLYSYCM